MKKYKWISIVSLLILAMIVVIAPFLYFSFFHLPNDLIINQYQHYSYITNDQKIVVNVDRPSSLKDEAIESQLAKQIVTHLKEEGYTHIGVILDVTYLNDEKAYVSVSDINSDVIWNYFIDCNSITIDESIDFSLEFKQMIRQEFLQLALSDLRYSDLSVMDIITKLDSINVLSTVDYSQPNMIFTCDLGFGQLTVSKDMSYYLDDINVNLGLQRLDNPLKYSVSQVDTNLKSIYIVIDKAVNRANDYYWSDLFYNYGQRLTFNVIGNKIDGNEDVILSLLNHGHQLATCTMDYIDLSQSYSDEILDYQLYGPIRKIERLTNHMVSPTLFVIPNNNLEEVNLPFHIIDSTMYVDDPDLISSEAISNLADGTIITIPDGNREFYEAFKNVLASLVNTIQFKAIIQ